MQRAPRPGAFTCQSACNIDPVGAVRPCEWTDPDGDVFRRTPPSIRKPGRARIARCRVKSARVVTVDEPGQVLARAAERFAGHRAHRLDLERLDEVFRPGVVIGMAPPARRAHPPVPCKHGSMAGAGRLAGTVRTVDAPLCRAHPCAGRRNATATGMLLGAMLLAFVASGPLHLRRHPHLPDVSCSGCLDRINACRPPQYCSPWAQWVAS